MTNYLPPMQTHLFKGSLIYDGNDTVSNSLQFNNNARTNAYMNSFSQKNVELKAQDFQFKSNPTLPLEPQNNNPIFSNRTGTGEGKLIGNRALVKEVTVKMFPYMNIQDSTTVDVPEFLIHYALVYSKEPYFGASPTPNPVRFSDVFSTMDSTNGTIFTTPLSYKSVSKSDRYTILVEKFISMGPYNPNLPGDTATTSTITPNYNSGPFSQYAKDFVNLWDATTMREGKIDPKSSTVLFSEGLEVIFEVTPNQNILFNNITTGSLWVVVDVSPPLSKQLPQLPTIEYYTRVLYSDASRN